MGLTTSTSVSFWQYCLSQYTLLSEESMTVACWLSFRPCIFGWHSCHFSPTKKKGDLLNLSSYSLWTSYWNASRSRGNRFYDTCTRFRYSTFFYCQSIAAGSFIQYTLLYVFLLLLLLRTSLSCSGKSIAHVKVFW